MFSCEKVAIPWPADLPAKGLAGGLAVDSKSGVNQLAGRPVLVSAQRKVADGGRLA
jgi:hypothetical protein